MFGWTPNLLPDQIMEQKWVAHNEPLKHASHQKRAVSSTRNEGSCFHVCVWVRAEVSPLTTLLFFIRSDNKNLACLTFTRNFSEVQFFRRGSHTWYVNCRHVQLNTAEGLQVRCCRHDDVNHRPIRVMLLHPRDFSRRWLLLALLSSKDERKNIFDIMFCKNHKDTSKCSPFGL